MCYFITCLKINIIWIYWEVSLCGQMNKSKNKNSKRNISPKKKCVAKLYRYKIQINNVMLNVLLLEMIFNKHYCSFSKSG